MIEQSKDENKNNENKIKSPKPNNDLDDFIFKDENIKIKSER